MPPRLENQYFLDCACEATHIASDVYTYFMHVCRDVDAYIDGFDEWGYRSRVGYSKHWNTLQRMGLHCEAGYLAWRATHRMLALGTSYDAYDRLPVQVEQLVENYAHCLVDSGFEKLSPLALLRAEQHFGFSNDVNVLKRAARRACYDLDEYDACAILDARNTSLLLSAEYRMEVDRTLAEVRRYLDQRNRQAPPDLTVARAQMAAERRRQKSIINRSKSFVRGLIGKHSTRMLLKGNAIQIQGELATYEIKLTRTDKLEICRDGHGSAIFSVFTRDGTLELCRLCIYTDDVPVLDHVASLILHIQAGEEEKILKIGNAFQIDPLAYEEDWLIPFLPKRRSAAPLTTPWIGFGARHIVYPREERQQRILAMSGLLLDWVKDEVGRWLPSMETTEHKIRTGNALPGSREDTHVLAIEMPEDEAADPARVAQARADIRLALRVVATQPAVMIGAFDEESSRRRDGERLRAMAEG